MKKNFIFILALLLLASSVHAENVYREPQSTTSSTLYFYNFPYWIEVNETVPLYITNYGDATTNYAEINLSGGNATNMTYLSGSDLFRTYLTSSAEEDVAFTITIKDSSGITLATVHDTLRFRIPFDVEFKFFKNTNTTSTSVEPYDNEFQYAAIYYNPSGNSYSYTLESSGGVGWLNNIGRLFPYYKDIGGSEQVRVTDEIYLWARLQDGIAVVKVYENGTYDLNTVNTKLYGGITPMYEFGRPIQNGQIEFDSAQAGDIKIGEETDASYSVFISAWEVYKWNLVMNISKILLVLIGWGLCVVVISFLMTAWLPTDVREKAFGIVLGTIATVTSPILIIAVRLVW